MLANALERATGTLTKELEIAPLRNLNESVFRHHFLMSAYTLHPDIECQTEWKRIDLLLQREGQNHAIEFKFYGDGTAHNLDGSRWWRKGGPGKKNRDEFFACVEKLANLEQRDYIRNEKAPITDKHLILGYHIDSCSSSYRTIIYPDHLRGAIEHEHDGPDILEKGVPVISTKIIKVASRPHQ